MLININYAGVGAGVGSAINAQIARTTTPKERTAMFSMAMGLRQVGLLIGRLISTLQNCVIV